MAKRKENFNGPRRNKTYDIGQRKRASSKAVKEARKEK